jgi:hypothetical protein
MHPEIRRMLQEIETTNWKQIPVEYGREILNIRVPPHCEILTMKETPGRPSKRPSPARLEARRSKRSSAPKENRRRGSEPP